MTVVSDFPDSVFLSIKKKVKCHIILNSNVVSMLTAEVSGYGSDSCRESGNSPGNSSLVGSVLRSAAVLVHPEGLVRSDTESAYFCANGV
jgi:hypothetical protein